MASLWKKICTSQSFHKENKLPELPGVYFFLDEHRDILYIGKATSLRDRVKSYFARDLMETRGPKIMRMLEQVRFIAYQEADSVLEALILEAGLIKTHQPPYNTDAKDDKSYKHIVITQEKFPRVLIVRGRDIEQKKFTEPVKYMFGPFPSGGALREALKIIRKLFPFRDKCLPVEVLVKGGAPSKKRREPKPCFSAQIGLCPGVCTGAISAREYQRTINHIRLFFEGRKGALVRKLEREMNTAARKLDFERAQAIKKTLFGLRHIQDMALVKSDVHLDGSDASQHMRIEAYDVAHLGGTASVGVVTVVQGGAADPSQYRQFKLRGGHNGNDLSALEEILTRRLGHREWPLPEIVVVDGGELQYGVAEQVLRASQLTIPLVGVVKNAKHQPERLIGPEVLTVRFKREILLANNEAHRFAIVFHRKRRSKEFLS
jgi:excinuclease ABC subunit C